MVYILHSIPYTPQINRIRSYDRSCFCPFHTTGWTKQPANNTIKDLLRRYFDEHVACFDYSSDFHRQKSRLHHEPNRRTTDDANFQRNWSTVYL